MSWAYTMDFVDTQEQLLSLSEPLVLLIYSMEDFKTHDYSK